MARDYRNFSKYDILDIYYNKKETKEWLGKRMAFLWECRQYYTDKYMNNGLNIELQSEFYSINDEVVQHYANKDYSGYKDYELSDEAILDAYNNLEKLKLTNPKEFLLKKNKLLYDYCKIQIENREL